MNYHLKKKELQSLQKTIIALQKQIIFKKHTTNQRNRILEELLLLFFLYLNLVKTLKYKNYIH